MHGGRVRCALAGVALVACRGDAPAPSAVAQAEVSPSAASELVANAACSASDNAAARVHLLAAIRVRAGIALAETGGRWQSALDTLSAAQRACLVAASVGNTEPTAPARALINVLGRDLALSRTAVGGVPPLAWRLHEDAAVRATAELVAAQAALDAGDLDGAHVRVLAAQRARLAALPEIFRFLDETARAEVLADTTWLAWLGVSA